MLAYLLFIVVIIFTVRFVPIIAVRRPSRGNFIGILTNILFMAYHTSRYIDAIACAGQILVQWESFIFCHYLRSTWYHALDVFSMATRNCTVLARLCRNLGLLVCSA